MCFAKFSYYFNEKKIEHFLLLCLLTAFSPFIVTTEIHSTANKDP